MYNAANDTSAMGNCCSTACVHTPNLVLAGKHSQATGIGCFQGHGQGLAWAQQQAWPRLAQPAKGFALSSTLRVSSAKGWKLRPFWHSEGYRYAVVTFLKHTNFTCWLLHSNDKEQCRTACTCWLGFKCCIVPPFCIHTLCICGGLRVSWSYTVQQVFHLVAIVTSLKTSLPLFSSLFRTLSVIDGRSPGHDATSSCYTSAWLCHQ